MSELPVGWVESSVGEINRFRSSTINPAGHPDERYELYSVPAFPTRQAELILGKGIGSTKQVVQPDDVLVCKINPRINRVWVVPPAVGDTQIASSEWIVVRNTELQARYLSHYFASPSFREMICQDLTGVGGSLTRAQPRRVAALPLPLAPVSEQKRIADKLDALLARVDACRDRLDRVPLILKRFRQTILAAATSGELTADWRRHEDSGISRWTRRAVGDVIDRIEAGLNVQCIERPPKPNERGLIKISAVTWGCYDDNESKTLPPGREVPERTRVRVGDFLISRANTLELVGACVLVDAVSRPVFLSDKVLRLQMPESRKKWMLYCLRSPKGRRQIEQLASGNQLSMRNLSQGNLRSIEIPMPPENEQGEIVRRVEALFAYADRLEARYQAARAQVDGLTAALLAKAFRGELVPQDPNDEPASVLLERIRASRDAAPARPQRSGPGIRRRNAKEDHRDSRLTGAS